MVERNIKYLENISLDEIKGFGEKRLSSFKKHGINNISDLLRFFPKKHIDRSQISKIDSITTDITKEITILGEVTDVSVFTTKTRLRIATLAIKDDTGVIRAKWFGPQYIETRFKKGDSVAISGIPDVKKTGSIEFKNATIEKFSDLEELNETGSLIPIYPKIEGLSSTIIRKGIKEALRRTPKIEDFASKQDLTEYKIIDRISSYKNIHFPETIKEYELAAQEGTFDNNKIFEIYLSTPFTINQLLNAETIHKSLDGYESRALIYQKSLLSDNIENQFSNFHIQFFIKLTKFYGIDILSSTQLSPSGSEDELLRFIDHCINKNYEVKYNSNNILRNKVLNLLTEYYSRHMDINIKLNSTEVLKEIFN